MKKSVEKVSSDKSSSDIENLFSFKRYFINCLDSYHGEHILKNVSKILEKNVVTAKQSLQTIGGEDAGAAAPSPAPEQPYEIIGTVSDQKIKSLENVARIVPRTECLPKMLTCGTVILDVSCDREELRIAMDYVTLLKELLEKQTVATSSAAGTDDDGGESRRRYLILLSTVMTWACTQPLDPNARRPDNRWGERFSCGDCGSLSPARLPPGGARERESLSLKRRKQFNVALYRKALYPEDTPDVPFVETDFRKRRPHPNYKLHYNIENEVIGLARKYRPHIGALVLATGVTYGGREDVLFYWFQKAWECELTLPILGRGNNVVPLINVIDLAQIIYNLIVDFPKKLYILAVEQNITKQREVIVKSLGRGVGSGMFQCIPPEDAFLIPEIDQRTFDLMTLNLNMEPAFIVETMGLQWVSEATLGENVYLLMKQFKKERGLKPFKVIVYGPPIVGKTTLAKLICEAYGLIYVSPDTVAHDIQGDLEWRVNQWNVGETAGLAVPAGEEEDVNATDADDDVGDEEAVQEVAKMNLAILQSGRALTEDEILGYLRQRLLSREALNRGWVLDGFPASLAQCVALFDKGDEYDSDDEEEANEEPFDEDVELYSNVLKKMLPDVVVSLEATDDYICEKAMRQPEGDSRLDEEVVLKRLSEFRAGDARDITPLNFFDELDIHPLVVPVKDHLDYTMKNTYSAVALRMGRPCRYGKLNALIEAAEKKEKEERDSLQAKEEKALKELERKMKEEREEKMEYWTELYALLREEEESALAAAGEPMRNYLVHHIFPTLTPALLEVAKLRPEDPIDFLAEYLFKLNPSGKMLEPGYNLQAEKLLGKIKILDQELMNLDIKIDPLIPPEAEVEQPKKDINIMNAL